MLVGAWAKRGAVLWILGVPFAIHITEGLINGTDHFESALFRHIHPSLGVELSGGTTSGQVLKQIATLDFWGGLAIGLVLLGLTVYCRRTRNEI